MSKKQFSAKYETEPTQVRHRSAKSWMRVNRKISKTWTGHYTDLSENTNTHFTVVSVFKQCAIYAADLETSPKPAGEPTNQGRPDPNGWDINDQHAAADSVWKKYCCEIQKYGRRNKLVLCIYFPHDSWETAEDFYPQQNMNKPDMILVLSLLFKLCCL